MTALYTEAKKRRILGPLLYTAKNSRLFDEYIDILQGKLHEKRRYARRLRSNLTEEEEAFWDILNVKQFRDEGLRFRRQEAKMGYVLDFYCRNSCLCVELDGDYHTYPEQLMRDTIRDTNMDKIGIKTIRLPNSVLDDQRMLKFCIKEITEIGVQRIAMYKHLGIKKPNLFIDRKALKYGFVRWADTDRVAVGWDHTLIF